MPPVMGAGAFIMSTYTQISYLEIVAVSFLPAILYFLSVAFWVRIEALRRRVAPVRDDTLSLGQVLRSGGHALLPLAAADRRCWSWASPRPTPPGSASSR